MLVEMLVGKLHRGRVTACHLDYEGSITIDQELLAAAGILVHQKVQVLNIDNGVRIETYAIAGPAGGREIHINGAAARLFHAGDRIIVCAFALCTAEEARTLRPRIVLLDADNRIVA
ncbi:MAG: aspartate 1-decarboxylase [Planctomycetota bacterium]|nr:aspartate 1-decarboxylase [Planctomycetota bacterium]MCX8039960.1 aspartate 1-decarboxylase [Planctomycetota bacterium]MDW8372969.1 aspartate 1-decarboxylase [Planctomycetota bacterium]